MPNFFCGSLVVVRCGPQGLSVLFDRPGDRTAAVAAGYSYLLVSKGSAKTIRMSLSREQPPARVERAQQEQDFTAQKHAPFRLWRLGKQQAVCPRLRTPLQPPPAPGARFLGLSFSVANDNADFLPSKTELTRKYSNPLFVFHSASSRTEPPALRNFSISPAARLSRIASRIVQRLSKVCSSMRGCCSLTTRMMAFIAT